MNNYQQRTNNACIKFVSHIGYHIIDDDVDGFIVAYNQEDDCIVFVYKSIKDDNMDIEFELTDEIKKRYEHAMLEFFKNNNDYLDIPVQLDVLELHIIAESKGIIRYISNMTVRR